MTDRPKSAQCGNCVFYSFDHQQCRVDPPRVDPENDNAAVWPKTQPNDWCSSFSDDWKNTMEEVEELRAALREIGHGTMTIWQARDKARAALGPADE